MKLIEITRPYEKKLVDPALMTFPEYRQAFNRDNRSHPSSAYQMTAVDMKQRGEGGYLDRKEFPILLNRIARKGQMFEVRMRKEDRWAMKYVKHDAQDEIVRGPDGMALYMEPEEIQAMIPANRRWDYSFTIYNAEGDPVASAQNEWGAVLWMVAQEYRGFGLGVLLGQLTQHYHPERDSGGFTPDGWQNTMMVHRSLVQKYLQSGTYSWLVRSGQITPERVREIIASSAPNEVDRDWQVYKKANPNARADGWAPWNFPRSAA